VRLVAIDLMEGVEGDDVSLGDVDGTVERKTARRIARQLLPGHGGQDPKTSSVSGPGRLEHDLCRTASARGGPLSSAQVCHGRRTGRGCMAGRQRLASC
jgi:hypothetical protein